MITHNYILQQDPPWALRYRVYLLTTANLLRVGTVWEVGVSVLHHRDPYWMWMARSPYASSPTEGLREPTKEIAAAHLIARVLRQIHP